MGQQPAIALLCNVEKAQLEWQNKQSQSRLIRLIELTFFLEWYNVVSVRQVLVNERTYTEQQKLKFHILGVRPQICITTHPDTVLPVRVECKNVATINIPPKMAASSVISVKVC